MRSNGSKRHTASSRVALCGVFSGLATVVMLAGGYIPVGTFAAPIFAGLCLVPIVADVGVKWALLCYAAVSVLSTLLVPDIELVLFFICLMGYYPVLHPVLQKIKSRVLRIAAKLLLFNTAVAAVYALLLFVFLGDALRQELAGRAVWFWAAALAVANVVFVLYDILLDKVKIIYIQRIRRFFNR